MTNSNNPPDLESAFAAIESAKAAGNLPTDLEQRLLRVLTGAPTMIGETRDSLDKLFLDRIIAPRGLKVGYKLVGEGSRWALRCDWEWIDDTFPFPNNLILKVKNEKGETLKERPLHERKGGSHFSEKDLGIDLGKVLLSLEIS